MMTFEARLSERFDAVSKIILERQDAVTGLLPASTAVNAHGDYTDAWVRDNVYSILCVWGLSLAYKRHDPANARSLSLSLSVVKLMRGLLTAMMRQSDRVERFKRTQNPLDALHAKYGTQSGLAVVGDNEWGHLQLDATSLFLLMLAQMTASGLQIVYTDDEVDFVQNLVHYISRTYATPDYGIWERGNKINHGDPEINCSSVGMAKAALEALDGFNLYGTSRGLEGVIHVVASDIARSRFTLHGLLPRESTSKETDAALLSIIGYPAYAVEDAELTRKTAQKIRKKLAGRYGCKRFLLDGHQSVLEDTSRLHYEAEELRQFEHIESEWPLFFTYLMLDALLRGDTAAAQEWKTKLEPLFVEVDGVRLLPELYIVPEALIEAEKAAPGSQERRPNENVPLVWAQSLYLLASLLDDGLLIPDDIDPLRRRERVGATRTTTPLVAVVAESRDVKARLHALGIRTETLEEATPAKVLHASELTRLFSSVGANRKLHLSGRPQQVSRTIATSRLYQIGDETYVFLPYHFDPRAFYLHYDNRLLVEHVRSSLKFLAENWDQPGRPLMLLLVRDDMLESTTQESVLELLRAVESGSCCGTAVQSGPLHTLLGTASREQMGAREDFLPETPSFRPLRDPSASVAETFAPYQLGFAERQQIEQHDDETLAELLYALTPDPRAVEALQQLWRRHGEAFAVQTAEGELPLKEIAQQQYEAASARHDWAAVRRLADLLYRYDERLEDVLLDIIIRQKRLAVGRAYFEKATFCHPVESTGIVETIYAYCGNSAAETVLTQEIILHLGHLIRIEPELFDQLITVRTWYFVQLLVSRISRETSQAVGDAYETLLTLAPHEILHRLREVLQTFATERRRMNEMENLRASGFSHIKSVARITELSQVENWMQWRHDAGLIGHHAERFYKDVWYLLQQCDGIVIGDKYDSANRVGSEQTLDTTAGERSFELRIDALLQGIQAPEYRQLNLEAIESLTWLFRQNPELKVENDIVLDVLIGHAVRLAWTAEHGDAHYNEQRGQAWEAFYHRSPRDTEAAFVDAFRHLLQEGFE
ncbi:glycoside hydrolase family 15 protein [Sulfurimonas sp. HSL1-2]|uniref:glycoside hydrolase family 15 protein n=1 Tax=Thiomicrolovo zhangzhouensis TaxID=3131933 RepID=UPI0031F9F2C7